MLITNRIMNIQSRLILTIATFALASMLPNEVSADELKEAKVTQAIQTSECSHQARQRVRLPLTMMFARGRPCRPVSSPGVS